ncbi:hypothetical protein O6H91_05G015300 [Diphasiastrum complanatum]|nr:hypothetical protein O6H91_05G015300 [Diphasiastrum complanatum]
MCLRLKRKRCTHRKNFHNDKFEGSVLLGQNKLVAEQKEFEGTYKFESLTDARTSSPSKSGSLSRRQVVGGLSLATGFADSVFGVANPSRALVQTGSERDERRASSSALEMLKSRVSTFTLGNGMRWIVLERHTAPVVSCHTYANVGAADEAAGITGIAHLLEHLAFKGTKLVGTRDAEAEAALLDQLDAAFYALLDAKRQSRTRDIAGLSAKFEDLKDKTAQLSIPNEYGALISREGGIDLNAETSQDATEYYVSLPANKLELWMALESGRFIAPVFRELYSEKEVVKEERRLRVDNTPYGRFTEVFAEAAFPGLPYGRPILGYPEDFEGIGRKEVAQFFEQHYTPAALTCAIVGDVTPADVEKLAIRYFGGWMSLDSLSTTASTNWRSADGWDLIPRRDAASSVRLRTQVQPLYMEGYYRPPTWSTDDPALSVLNELLSGGRGSRFYKNLIIPGKALSAESSESYPGDKQSSLLLVYGAPPLGTSTDVLAESLHHELGDLAKRKVKEEELAPIKKASKVGLLEAFRNNRAMARLLSRYEATTGSWAHILQEMEEVERISADNVLRVASLLFNHRNTISGYTGDF